MGRGARALGKEAAMRRELLSEFQKLMATGVLMPGDQAPPAMTCAKCRKPFHWPDSRALSTTALRFYVSGSAGGRDFDRKSSG